MGGRDPGFYGDEWAGVYDEVHRGLDTATAVAALAALSGGGPVLELGVGTGRLALPLAARGVAVHGVDASEAMLARLRDKPGGGDLPVTCADFTAVRLPRRFALVLVAFNTVFSLPTQEAQVRCFATAAAHLRPGGRFVVEAFVPDLRRFEAGEPAGERGVQRGGRARDDGPPLERHDPVTQRDDGPPLERHDPVTQRVDSVHLHTGKDGLRFLPVSIRYAWPSELDLMARLAGLSLEQRWSDWHRRPFTAASTAHVSVYRLPA